MYHHGGGPLVQRKAVEAMSSVSEIVLNHLKMKIEDFDYLIPHQANLRILHALEKKMDIENNSPCQMIKCIKNTGNLSSSTLPVALDLLRKGKLEITYLPKNKSLLTSVGGGYTFSALALQFN